MDNTAEIRERHEEMVGDIENLWSQCRNTPDASMDEEMIAHKDRGILLDKLKDLEYRHETLKIMYADAMGFQDDDVPVELAIDEFISEEQSHS